VQSSGLAKAVQFLGAVAMAGVVTSSVMACGGTGPASSPTNPRCVVATTLVGDLTDGLIEHIALLNVYAVKSSTLDDIYFVSAGLHGAGLDGSRDIATWATDSLTGHPTISSVNELAMQHSIWSQGFSMSDDGARESADCASD
jgi:hypothetical protein